MNNDPETQAGYVQTILFVIRQPAENERVPNNTWTRTVKTLEDDKSLNKFVKKLGPGTYLLDAPDGLPFLGLGIYQCEKEGLRYSIGLLREAPNIADFYQELSPIHPQ
jgi:hypothetical protein